MARKKLARSIAAVAAAGALTGAGLWAPAANAAAKPQGFWTPRGLWCTVWTGGSFGAYTASGQCTDGGKWRVVARCSVTGIALSSVWLFNWPGQTQTSTVSGTCFWGVASVGIEDAP